MAVQGTHKGVQACTGEPLKIDLKAEVDVRRIGASPRLTIAFEPGRFRNRTINVFPFKLEGPTRIEIARAIARPHVNGELDAGVWNKAVRYPLLSVPPHVSEAECVQFLADEHWLYVAARFNAAGRPREASGSRVAVATSLPTEQLRLDVREQERVHSFAVRPENLRSYSCDGKEDPAVIWRSGTHVAGDAWAVEMAIPRALFKESSNLEVNVVHRRGETLGSVDCALRPAYEMGQDPDVLPDWKAVGTHEKFARLVLPAFKPK